MELLFSPGVMKQVGCIVFGGGLKARHWIEEAKKDGFRVMIRDGFAELWLPIR